MSPKVQLRRLTESFNLRMAVRPLNVHFTVKIYLHGERELETYTTEALSDTMKGRFAIPNSLATVETFHKLYVLTPPSRRVSLDVLKSSTNFKLIFNTTNGGSV